MEFVIASVFLSALLWVALPRQAHRFARIQARAGNPATRHSRESA